MSNKRSGIGERLWVHGRDISGDVGRLNNLSSPRGHFEAPGLNAAAMERILTHGDGAIDLNGWFNDGADQLHDAFSGLPATDLVALLAIGTARGDPGAAIVSKLINHLHNRTSEGAIEVQAQLEADGAPLEWGVMLTAGAETLASAGSLTSLDENGADGSSSNGGVGYLEYLSLGSGSPTLLIQDSPNASSWATLLTFDGGTPPLGERKTVTGNVDRHLRPHSTGSFSNAVIAMGFRRGTAQDDVAL